MLSSNAEILTLPQIDNRLKIQYKKILLGAMKYKIEFRKIICLALLIAADLAAWAAAFWTGYVFRNQIALKAFHLPLRALTLKSQVESGFFIFGAAIIVLIFIFEKLYIKRYSFWEEARRLFGALTLAFILMIMVTLIPATFPHFSRMIMSAAWLVSLFFFPFFRLIVKNFFKRSGLWRKNVLILGTNPMAMRVAREIGKNKTLCYELTGLLSEQASSMDRKSLEEFKIVGTLDQLSRELCQRLNVKDIFIALSDFPQKELIRIAQRCEELAETIKIVPHISSLYTLGAELENVGDVIAVSVARNLAKPWNLLLKHTYELALTALLFLLFVPASAILAVAIRLDSRGPVLFKQPRLGKKYKPFMIYKFRSMFVDNERRLNLYFQAHPEARQEWNRFRKVRKDDPRVTRIGRFIRKWSLDELPQLLNIIKGDMSLVGPRPYMLQEREHIGEMGKSISSVKPGMTGFWQIQGRNTVPFNERIFLDDYYIRNWSLWLDIVILLKTMRAIIKHEGAF